MLGNYKIILDSFCEIGRLIQPFMDGDFYDLKKHDIVPGAIYIISRQQFAEHKEYIAELVTQGTIHAILCNPAEGSESMFWLYKHFGIEELVKHSRTAVITGGDVPPEIPHFYFEHFLPLVYDYDENLQAIENYRNNFTLDKPYKFLFLNGRMRVHRKYLLERFRHNELLNSAIWSNLDNGYPYRPDILKYFINDRNVIPDSFPIKYLPPEYEYHRYREAAKIIPGPSEFQGIAGPDLYAKRHLFRTENQPTWGEWGEIYLEPRAYQDTYFSLVTETVFDYPYSFRTEKIFKPIAMGHPFIVASNAGFYRDMHDQGFRTFGHLIDESFDLIENPQDRIERVAAVVEDLCQHNLKDFAAAAQEICKYNQQLHRELSVEIRREFPTRFIKFINERFGI